MKTSETISKIAVALLEAQKGITFATKDVVNGHFKSKYADLSSVVDAVKPSLNDSGIAFVQSAGPSDDSKLHLTTRLIHTSGEWIEDTLVMPLPKQDPQGFGSAMTYARRYALAAITGLYQDDDDGNAGSGIQKQEYKNPAPVVTQPEYMPGKEFDELKTAVKECDEGEAAQSIIKGSWRRLTPAMRNGIMEFYNERFAKPVVA
jgi:ERF superfamily